MIKEGLPLVITQPGPVYGPGDTSSFHTTFVQYLTKKLPIMPQQTAFSWAHVDDVAHALWLAMEKGKAGENYHICGSTHTFVEVLKMAYEITGVRPPMEVPPSMVRVMSVMMSLFEKFIPVPEIYMAESLRVIAGVTYIGTNSKAKRELGYNPRPFKEGLSETLKYEMKLLGM
jgi:nucleoside-diphosphate-sugar epimerase